MDDKEFRNWNEKMFRKYNNVRLYSHPNPAIRYTESKRVSIILKALGSEGRVADIGCGEGYILSKINSPEIVGVDISDTALEMASKITNAKLVRANAESLPFSDSYFDAALCSEILEHTQNPRKVVLELSRIVKPGGKIIISVPNEPFINRIKDAIWNLGLFDILFPNVPKRQDDEWHLHSFDLKVLKKNCSGILDIVKVEATPFSFFPVRYIALCRNPKKGPASSGKLFPSENAGGSYE
jgi:2-polyprenyl-3-methyl-5-hydroxy-6-metoxy-1,4-benzoquinol methylase